MSFVIENFLWGEPRVVRPWDLPDRNPMPHITISPRLEHLLELWDEARLRFWVALDVIRHGPDEVFNR